jgi:hypothetical protein
VLSQKRNNNFSVKYMEKMIRPIEDLLSECAVFIRSVGERTEKVCEYSIIQNGIPKENISYVKNVSPFSRALRVGFEEAIKKNKKYSIFIDADMILLPNAFSCMLSAFEFMPESTFCMVPLSYTHIMGTISSGGPKIYRTLLLSNALKLIPLEAVSVRPETYTFKAMKKSGYEFIFLDAPLACQDFEQYNKDIFKKTINKYIKSSSKNGDFERKLKSAESGGDFAVAIMAVEYAKGNRLKLTLESDQFEDIFASLNLGEKNEIENVEESYRNLINGISKCKRTYLMDSYTSKWMRADEENSRFRKSWLACLCLKFLG